MKRYLWLCVLILLAGHVPTVSADAACESRFVNPITDICWSCIFPLSLGSTKVSQESCRIRPIPQCRSSSVRRRRPF